MTIQELGSLGEFVGAVAVVVSLIYLAVQVRRNTQQLASSERALLRAESNSAHAQWSSFRHLLINNPDVASIWMRGQEDLKGLTEVEAFQFTQLAVDFFYVINNMRERHKAGVVDPGLWSRNLHAAARFRSSPGGQEWWTAHKAIFLRELVDEIEDARDA